jgi:hypothetical protein
MFTGYEGDHTDLLVRYMLAMTPEEQRRLMGMSAGAIKATASVSRGDGNLANSTNPAGGLLARAH